MTITNNGPALIIAGKAIRLAELPSSGLIITGYTVVGTNASVKADAGNLNKATVTPSKTIGIDETIVVKVTANVAANAPASISNGIQVWGPDKPETGNPDDEDKTPVIPVNRVYTMGITKVADQSRVKAGENTTFTVTVTNNGPSEIAIGKVINLTERPSAGLTITDYEVTSSNAIAAGTTNQATLTTTKVIPKGATITVKLSAAVALDAPEHISNGISVWGPDKPTTEPEDDKDDTPEIPVDYSAPNAVDDRAETKSYVEIDIDVLANDEETRFEIDGGTVTLVGKPMGGTATVNADGTITYVSDRGFNGTDTFTYQVKDVEGNWSNEAMVTITVLENPLFFPNTFTPNGDGLNDRFEIKGLDQFTENELIIMNRWGNQVYNKPNYANEWTGENLNEGTYYYILKVRNHAGQWEVHKGAIAIIRLTR